MDHYHHPHHAGTLSDPTFAHMEENPLCGDVITLFVQLDRNHRVSDIRFQGSGCAISQAAASMFTDLVKGKTLNAIGRLTPEVMQQHLRVRLSPTRLKCALLAMRTFAEGKRYYLQSSK